MARASADVVRDALEALAGGGVEAMLPFVHDDFEMTTPAEYASEPDTYRGHEGIRRWFDSFYEAMDEVRLEPLEIVPAGEDVAVRARIVARGRSTSLEFVQDAATVCSVLDDRIHRLRFFTTWDEVVALLSQEG